MLRLIIGLRILRGPRAHQPRPAQPGAGKRLALIGICGVLIASAATSRSSGHAASDGAITTA
jgi:hypothetical protein